MGSITAPSPANSEIPENAFEINVTGPGTPQPTTPPAETSPDTVTVPDVDTDVGETTIVAADAGGAAAHTTKVTKPRRANIRRTADLLFTKTRPYANPGRGSRFAKPVAETLAWSRAMQSTTGQSARSWVAARAKSSMIARDHAENDDRGRGDRERDAGSRVDHDARHLRAPARRRTVRTS